MTTFKNAFFMILALLLQTTFMHKLSVFDIRPDIVLLVVIYVGVSRGHIEGTILGFLSGLVQDAYNPSYMGLNAFAKSIVGFGTGYGHGGVAIERPLVRALLIFFATLVHDFIYFLVYTGGHISRFFFQFLRTGIGTAIYTAVFGAIFAYLLLLAGQLLRACTQAPNRSR